MQTIAQRIIANFARVPSIKFLGPRDQIKHHNNHNNNTHVPPKKEVEPPSISKGKPSLSILSNGPGIKPTPYFVTPL